MAKGQKVLFLGVYGMEVVECGGALAKNVLNGGESFASIMLCRETSQPQVRNAAEILGVKDITFLNFQYGTVDLSVESKKKIIKIIREVKPDIIITQDPEHSFHDLDPDRRPAMTLLLESIALSSRDFALDELPGLDPHPIPTIYYMTPHHPNTVVDITEVWEKKERAMDMLESQLEFSGMHFDEMLDQKAAELLYPGFSKLTNFQEKGRAIHQVLDKAVHVYHGLATHGHFALAEAYRREGNFHLKELIV
ncbi:PIG-L family deacetylase [Bacillus sp. ISL-41]|uniref:PIG-L deacetylase family protein n=1 Tax=unclassified Bacillus (in: firmicutes) TaxID=185979 RepID=UPI001BE9D325|nr:MULTISPECIES: PIG-L family deacetylase [unclassified Bacillus (in: firmicutes)]MBT2640197.1 PIG-L family deacetylase [Bacillus sp. ISL-39]MBT2642550.1 PIG-L family deacetylase [Bacillus sp. ISL-41]